jgi:hypothetical protein
MHLPQVLCNLTRIEHGEWWSVTEKMIPSVAHLIEALDEERLQTAAAYGAQPIALSQFLERSFPVQLVIIGLAAFVTSGLALLLRFRARRHTHARVCIVILVPPCHRCYGRCAFRGQAF